MSNKANIVDLKEEYFDHLAVFLQTMTDDEYSSHHWLDKFNYWWIDNPNAKNIASYGRVIINETNEIKGFLGFVPFPYQFKGSKIISAGFTTWFVDEDYRGKSLLLLRSLLKDPATEIFFDTTPSDRAVAIFRALKFNSIKSDWHNKVNLKPINFSLLIDFYFHRKYSNTGILVLLKIFKIIPIQKIFDLLYLSFNSNSYYDVREMTKFTEEHSSIWDKVNINSSLYACRSIENANWLFWGSKYLRDSRICLEIFKGKKLLGYCVFDVCYKKTHDSKICFYQLKEWALIDTDKKSHHALLFSVISLARKNKNVAAINIEPFSIDIIKNLMNYGINFKKPSHNCLIKSSGANKEELTKVINENYKDTPMDGDRAYFNI
jgi:hypothetical protein